MTEPRNTFRLSPDFPDFRASQALVSAPGLLVFLVARSSFFTWATASIEPLSKRAHNRIRFISDVVPFSRECTTRAAAAPAGFTSGNGARHEWEDKDLKDLRKLISLALHWIEVETLTLEVIADMPEGKP